MRSSCQHRQCSVTAKTGQAAHRRHFLYPSGIAIAVRNDRSAAVVSFVPASHRDRRRDRAARGGARAARARACTSARCMHERARDACAMFLKMGCMLLARSNLSVGPTGVATVGAPLKSVSGLAKLRRMVQPSAVSGPRGRPRRSWRARLCRDSHLYATICKGGAADRNKHQIF